MRATRYSRHRITSPDLLVYTRLMAEDNGAELLRLRHALGHALREEVTRRQRQVLFLYYNENYTMAEIGAQLGVDRTTVSRTLKRGEQRLLRCLRYGARPCSGRVLGRTGQKISALPLTRGVLG